MASQQPLTFILSSSFLPSLTKRRAPFLSARRSSQAAPCAVLDRPAANTQLQRHAEVTLRDFLTRRSVNTVMYYMLELNDGPSRNFLNNFDRFAARVESHTFEDGDAYIDRMLKTADREGVMRVGSSRIWREFKFKISPNRIAKRIMDVRVQLAAEWMVDLACIEAENLELQREGMERLLGGEKEVERKRNLVFDSDPLEGGGCTPLRYGNYTMLRDLSTRHAVARLLPFMRDCGSNHEYMYLLEFVRWRGGVAKFDGEAFLRDLMKGNVEKRTNPLFEIRPRGIALQLLELRKVIAEEWMAVLADVPMEMKLRDRERLERSMDLEEE